MRSARFVSPPTSDSAYSRHASRIPAASSITHARSTSRVSATEASANLGEAPIAARSETLTAIAFTPSSCGEIVARSKCTPSTNRSVVRTSSPLPGTVTAASSPGPTMTRGSSVSSTRAIAATSSSSVRSTTVPSRRIGGGRAGLKHPRRTGTSSRASGSFGRGRWDGGWVGYGSPPCANASARRAPRALRPDDAPSVATHGETEERPLTVQARTIHDNPSPEELRRFTQEMSQARVTEFDNVNVQTKVVSRSAGSTYVVGGPSSGKTMTREEYDRIAQMQDEYLRDKEVIVVDGYIGNDPEFRTKARLSIEKANANIAGMQQKLYFPRKDRDDPEVQVIYTPNLPAPGYPDERVIAVDLDNGVTRVLNSDYFGESKKGGLRMWNKKVYDLGGLSLHAGLKVIPTNMGEKVFMIIGLSGTGKTTTTFTV